MTKNNTMTICAVVPTFNRTEYLKRCLDALISQHHALDQIIVVDNGSIEPVMSFVKKNYGDVFTCIRLPENTGSAGGYAAGMMYGYQKGYDWIWLMDNDAQPFPDALERIVDSNLMEDGRLRILSCAVCSSDGSIGRGHKVLFDRRKLSKVEINREAYRLPHFRVDLASYTGLLLSKEVINRIGLPLHKLFLYWDDFDYCLRLAKAGGEIFVIPDSKLIHDTPNSTEIDRQYYVIRNKIYVCKSHFGSTPAFRRLMFSLIARRIGRIILLEDQKRLRLRTFLLAIKDALQGRLGEYKHGWKSI
jgi:GT2 family glycosyltransferase